MKRIAPLFGVLVWVLGAARAYGAPVKLLYLGWDSPSLVELAEHPREFESLPFDGLIFWAPVPSATGGIVDLRLRAWSRDRISLSLVDDLEVPLTRLRERGPAYHFLRVGVTTGDVDWFDDQGWEVITQNFAIAAQLARRAGARGLFFDTEQYREKVFSLGRISRSPRPSWEVINDAVKHRGTQLIRSIEREYPDLEIIFSHAYSAVAEWTASDPRALRAHDYALLPAFLDGILEGASERVRLIDGYENSYGFKTASEFGSAVRRMKTLGAAMSSAPIHYLRRFQLGFGLWLDYRSGERGWDSDRVARNYFTPETFSDSTSAALSHAESYVWIYAERVSWWPGSSAPSVPESYRRALSHSRRPAPPERPRDDISAHDLKRPSPKVQ